jgi:hypothetical protein
LGVTVARRRLGSANSILDNPQRFRKKKLRWLIDRTQPQEGTWIDACSILILFFFWLRCLAVLAVGLGPLVVLPLTPRPNPL